MAQPLLGVVRRAGEAGRVAAVCRGRPGCPAPDDDGRARRALAQLVRLDVDDDRAVAVRAAGVDLDCLPQQRRDVELSQAVVFTSTKKSADDLAWEDAGLVTKERIPDEADIRFLPDGSLEMVARTCDKAGNSMWLRSGPGRAQWEKRDLEPVIHCPVFAEWGDRCFVAGRGKDEKG